MDKQKLKEKRDALVQQAYKIIEAAEEISDEIGEGFSWSLAYGMGGYYQAAGEDDYYDSDYEDSDVEVQSSGWVSSSHNC